MIVEHYKVQVEVPRFVFGNERDIRARDILDQIAIAKKNKKKAPAEKVKADILALMNNLKHLYEANQ